jgi:hypothetical protein
LGVITGVETVPPLLLLVDKEAVSLFEDEGEFDVAAV